jgi:hypothetical protein
MDDPNPPPGIAGGLLVDPPELGEQPGGYDSRAVLRHFGPRMSERWEELIRRHYTPAQTLLPRSVAVPATGTPPVQLCERNLRRIGLAITNLSSTVVVYFGDRADVVVGQAGEPGAGFPLPALGLFTFGREYCGPVWAIAGGDGAEVRVLELLTAF